MMHALGGMHLNPNSEDHVSMPRTGYEKELIDSARSIVSDLMLPNGDRFGDFTPADLHQYADKTMEEIIKLLIDPKSDDEAPFLEDGAGAV
jgi:hypothetical protein